MSFLNVHRKDLQREGLNTQKIDRVINKLKFLRRSGRIDSKSEVEGLELGGEVDPWVQCKEEDKGIWTYGFMSLSWEIEELATNSLCFICWTVGEDICWEKRGFSFWKNLEN